MSLPGLFFSSYLRLWELIKIQGCRGRAPARTQDMTLKFVFFDTGIVYLCTVVSSVVYLKRARNPRVMKSGASFLPYIYIPSLL